MFVVFEGIDGTGKATQLKLLENYLNENSFSVSTFDFPAYDSFIGKEIGTLLSKKDKHDAISLPPKVMSILFAVDRSQFRSEIVRSLERDQFTLCNRYSLSNIVFQSVRAGYDLSEWIQTVEHSILELPKPDMYIVFNSPPNISKDLVSPKGIRSYNSDADLYESDSALMASANDFYSKIQLLDTAKVVIDMYKNDGQTKSVNEIYYEVRRVFDSKIIGQKDECYQRGDRKKLVSNNS